MCTSRHAYWQLPSAFMQKQNNRNAWKLVGMYVQITLSALWIIHKCLEVSGKCHYEATWEDYFFLPVLSFPTWIGLAGSVRPWKWCQYNSEAAAREYKTVQVLCKQWLFSFLFHWQLDVLALFFFFFKIRLPEPGNITLHL